MANISSPQNAFLESARETFQDLESNQRASRTAKDIQSAVQKIRDDLRKAGVTAGALDETGVSTPMEMERRIRKAANGQHIFSARQSLTAFETFSTLYDKALITKIVAGIWQHLSMAGANAAALDETGTSSKQKMEARIDKAVVRANLISARRRLAGLEISDAYYDEGTIAQVVKDIRDHLGEARADASALDQTGQSTVAEMEDRIQAAAVRMHLRSARKDFELLDAMKVPKDKQSIENIVKKIRNHLISAGTDASALDETGQTTKQDMEDRVRFAMAAIHPMARNAFADSAAPKSASPDIVEEEYTSQRSVMEITRDMSRGFSIR